MEVLEYEHDLCGVKLASVVIKATGLPKVCEELSTNYVLERHVKVLCICNRIR